MAHPGEKSEEGRVKMTSCPPKSILPFHSNRDLARTSLPRQKPHLPACLAASGSHVTKPLSMSVSSWDACSFCLACLRGNPGPGFLLFLSPHYLEMLQPEGTWKLHVEDGSHYPKSLNDGVEYSHPHTCSPALDLLIKSLMLFV